ncbi:MAG: hypothetical protein Q4G35_02790 [Propionibacteriaceae bacterium]|nr:hypothetical protein [Propionibacteriaceae bacterium]
MITIRELGIRVHHGRAPWDETQPYSTVELILDGRSLQGWVEKTVPHGQDVPEHLGHPTNVDLRALLQGELAHEDSDEPGEFAWERWGGLTSILGCSCGHVDCGPLLCHITMGDDVVTWTDFREGFEPERTYDLAFQFSRATYDAALNSQI